MKIDPNRWQTRSMSVLQSAFPWVSKRPCSMQSAWNYKSRLGLLGLLTIEQFWRVWQRHAMRLPLRSYFECSVTWIKVRKIRILDTNNVIQWNHPLWSNTPKVRAGVASLAKIWQTGGCSKCLPQGKRCFAVKIQRCFYFGIFVNKINRKDISFKVFFV